jgi:DNA-directed RNA polymerase beta' subunit
MVTTGSKGSFGNTKLMLIRMGQALNDNRPLPFLFDHRLNAFYKKYDLDPRSHGMILDSYLQGLTPSQLLTNAIPERTQMLNKVLTVAKPGYLGRKMIKNLEPLLVNNLRICKKERAITEFLFAHDGF